MAVMWTLGVRTGKLTIPEFVAVTSTNCAKIFNIYPRKGAIAVGADADIVVWDPELSRTISVKEHLQNIDFNIYEGMEVQGVCKVSLSRGRVVWNDGDVRTERGAGRYTKRKPFANYWAAQLRKNKLAEPTPVHRG